MESNRRLAAVAGLLFILATVANVVGTTLTSALLAHPVDLAKITANSSLMTGGALLELVAAGACAGIAIALYPVLRMWGRGLALGSVVFRTIEAVFYMVGTVGLLSVLVLSQQFTAAAVADHGAIRAAANSLLALREQASMPAVMAFTVGALMYYVIFYRSRLIPRWLSGWGIVGILLAMVACLLALFTRNPITNYAVVMLPIAVQEMVLAVWLLVKGFDPAVLREAVSLSTVHG